MGGIEIGMHAILAYIADHTQSQVAVITATTGFEPQTEQLDGVEVFRYRRSRRWGKWFLPLLYAFLNTGPLLRRLQPDVVCIPYILPTGIPAWYAAKAISVPVVMSVGGFDIYDPNPNLIPPKVLHRWAAYCLQRTDIIIAWSEWVKQRLISHFDVRPETIHVIPFGVDIERLHPGLDKQFIRSKHGIAPDKIVLLALQRLDPRKGIDVLLRALKTLVANYPNVHLIVAGKGPELEKLQSLAEQLELTDFVTFAGFVSEEEKPLYYAAADIFVFHSYYEGLGIVLEEASASGLPIVTADAAGTRDIVVEGETGYIVPPGNAERLAEAVVRLLNQPETRDRYGKRGRQLAQDRFSKEVISSTYLRLFEQACVSARTP